MKSRITLPFAILVLALVCVAATRLVAMRVEVEPLRTLGDDTVMAVSVQVAPEDRVRVGDRAWLQVELSHGERTVDRVSRAAELDADGQARLEVAWPPGDYDLRVQIESGRGKATGFWLGPVTVPGLEAGPPAAAEPPAARQPAPPAATPPPEPEPTAPVRQPQASDAEPPATPPPVERPAAEPAPEAEPTPEAEPEPEPPQPSPATQPEPAPTVPAPVAPPDSATVSRRIGDWTGSAGDLDEFTVLVTERNQPVLGLGRTDLKVEAEGRDLSVEAVGGSGTAPLLLALAVDVSPATVEQFGEVYERLGRMALQVQGGHGMVSLLTPAAAEPTLDWGATPEQLAEALTAATRADEADLAGLVSNALARFDDRSGRKLLLLVTDGDDAATRGAWDQAEAAAKVAGVPILVLGFRGDGLDNRLKSRLNRLATWSGGKTHFVWESGLLKVVFDFYSELMEAAYAVRVTLPRPGDDEPLRLRVQPALGGYEVLHPRTVR